MKIADKRREMLRKWFEQRTIPPKEKSYLSQLMGGTAPFGEKAARRLEADYGMGNLYLDGTAQGGPDLVLSINAQDTSVQLKAATARTSPPPEVDLCWVTAEDRQLLTLFHSTDNDGRAAILRTAEAMPRVMRPAIVGNKL